jgi:predicted dehydrogenase
VRVGLIGTGAISYKHAQAYKNIGWEVTVCNDISEKAGEKFCAQFGCEL